MYTQIYIHMNVFVSCVPRGGPPAPAWGRSRRCSASLGREISGGGGSIAFWRHAAACAWRQVPPRATGAEPPAALTAGSPSSRGNFRRLPQ